MRLALWLGGSLLGLVGLLAAPQPAHALDGLVLREGAWMMDLTAFAQRVDEGEAHFVLQNAGDKDVSLELELALPPPAFRFAAPPRLRLFDSLGREFVAPPARPHRLAFTLPQGGLTHFTLRAAHGNLPPHLGLHLWAGAARQDFAARLALVRRAALMVLAALYALVVLAGVLARSADGLIAGGAGMLALSAWAVAVWMPIGWVAGLSAAAALLWLGFHARAWLARRSSLRLYSILLLLVDGSLLVLAAQILSMQFVPQWYGVRAPLLMELLFVSMLLALGLGSLALARLARAKL